MNPKNSTPITLEAARLLGVPFRIDDPLFDEDVFRYKRTKEGFVLQILIQSKEGDLCWGDASFDYFREPLYAESFRESFYAVELEVEVKDEP